MPPLEKPPPKNFYGNVKLDEETSVDQLQAVAILTSPNPLAAEVDYLARRDNIKKVKNRALKILLSDLKPAEDDEWTATAASDSQFELDLHGMDATDRIYRLVGGDKLSQEDRDLGKAHAFTGQEYRAIQIYKRFLDEMQLLTLGVGTQIIEAALPVKVLEQLSHFALLKVMTKEDINIAKKQLNAIEEVMKKRTESFFSKENLDAQVKAGTLKPADAAKTVLLKQIYENQLAMIKKQRLNHVSTKALSQNTSLAAAAFHTAAAISNVLIIVANFVPVVNLFAHPLKLGLEMVNNSLLIAAYNLDPKMKEGPNQYAAHEREEIIQRRDAAKEHLQAIKTAKLKEVTTGLLGSAALVGAFFAGPLAPLFASIGAASLLVSNIYAQKAIQAEIDLLKKVGIKRDKEGNPVYEDVTTEKNGKTITIKQEVRLMKDYDLRIAGLEARLSGKKWSTYAAGSALGGTLGTAAIVGAILLGAASAAFPPLLIGIAVASACVALFCAIRSVKKTYDERKLTTKADSQINRHTVVEMDKNLNILSNRLNFQQDIKASMPEKLHALTDRLQSQKEGAAKTMVNKASRELSPPTADASASKDRLDEHQLTQRVESHTENLRDIAKPTSTGTLIPSESSQDLAKENKKDKDHKEEEEGRATKEKPF